MKRETLDAHSSSPASRSCKHLEADHSFEMTVETFAYRIIDQQFRYILAQEAGVIADQDPEFLHQMRVGLRRFQAAIAVFSPVLSGDINFKSGKKVLKSSGKLRDLDIQLERIQLQRQQAKTPGRQKSLIRLRQDLTERRQKVVRQVDRVLTRKTAYQSFKRTTQAWLGQPRFQAIAQLSIENCAPELLSPIVSRLLLHPAWLLPKTAMNDGPILHDLRKLCKQVRYQGEFFLPLYPKAFKSWIKEIKFIQSGLGQLQDAYVFGQFIQHYQPAHFITMGRDLAEECQMMYEWDELRQRYMDPQYRRSLHHLILTLKSD